MPDDPFSQPEILNTCPDCGGRGDAHYIFCTVMLAEYGVCLTCNLTKPCECE